MDNCCARSVTLKLWHRIQHMMKPFDDNNLGANRANFTGCGIRGVCGIVCPPGGGGRIARAIEGE